MPTAAARIESSVQLSKCSIQLGFTASRSESSCIVEGIKLRMVERVICLQTELHYHFVFDRYVLGDTHQSPSIWTKYRLRQTQVPWRFAESAACSEL
jgi:hypothetical protein